MLKPHKLCKVCKAVKDPVTKKVNKKLLNDIYNTTWYMKGSDTSLRQLAENYKHSGWFNYDNLKLHVKKHQFMSEADYNKRHLTQLANKAEKQILKHQLESVDVWNTVIEQGMEQLQDGDITIRTGDILKAAKDKSDFQFKKQDQDLKLAEMVAFFTSGQGQINTKDINGIIEGETVPATEESTTSLDSGQDRPSGVYYPPSWDASA